MPQIDFGWNAFVVSYKIGMYQNLLNLVNEQMEKDLVELAQEVEKVASQLEDDQRGDDYQDYLVNNYLEREEYQSIFLHAFFAASFAMLEHELVQVCENARRKAESPFSVKDLPRRDHLGSTKKYLKKLGIDFPAGSSVWRKAKEYGKVRNKIMHEGSSLGEDKDLIRFASEHEVLVETSPGIETKEYDLRLTRKFCEMALNDIKKVLIQVNVAYENWARAGTT